MVICLERGADLHTAQLMPLALTVSCFSKIQIGFTFLVLAHPGSPGKRAIKRVCVCVCECVSDALSDTNHRTGSTDPTPAGRDVTILALRQLCAIRPKFRKFFSEKHSTNTENTENAEMLTCLDSWSTRLSR